MTHIEQTIFSKTRWNKLQNKLLTLTAAVAIAVNFFTHFANVTDEHRADGFALKSNVRQKIETDTDIAIIGKTETETDIEF